MHWRVRWHASCQSCEHPPCWVLKSCLLTCLLAGLHHSGGEAHKARPAGVHTAGDDVSGHRHREKAGGGSHTLSHVTTGCTLCTVACHQTVHITHCCMPPQDVQCALLHVTTQCTLRTVTCHHTVHITHCAFSLCLGRRGAPRLSPSSGPSSVLHGWHKSNIWREQAGFALFGQQVLHPVHSSTVPLRCALFWYATSLCPPSCCLSSLKISFFVQPVPSALWLLMQAHSAPWSRLNTAFQCTLVPVRCRATSYSFQCRAWVSSRGHSAFAPAMSQHHLHVSISHSKRHHW